MKKTRILKIHERVRFNKWSQTSVPEIRLCGKWLKEAGFNEDDRVEVKISKGVMILKLV